MRLAYLTYGVGLARIVVYRKEDIRILISHVPPESEYPTVKTLSEFPPYTLVSPPIKTRGFFLEAFDTQGKKHGQCHCEFQEGELQITGTSGMWEGTLAPTELTDKETVHAVKTRGSKGLASTNIVLISRKWKDLHHLNVGVEGMQEWSDEGLSPIESQSPRRRFTGWTTKSGGMADELSVALVAVTSGPLATRDEGVRFLVWGPDGICMSGIDILPAVLVPEAQRFPKAVRVDVEWPPYLITGGRPTKPMDMSRVVV